MPDSEKNNLERSRWQTMTADRASTVPVKIGMRRKNLSYNLKIYWCNLTRLKTEEKQLHHCVCRPFYNVGYQYICNNNFFFKLRGASPDLTNAVASLVCNNWIVIQSGINKSQSILVYSQVLQRGPLSLSLFNLAVNLVYWGFRE